MQDNVYNAYVNTVQGIVDTLNDTFLEAKNPNSDIFLQDIFVNTVSYYKLKNRKHFSVSIEVINQQQKHVGDRLEIIGDFSISILSNNYKTRTLATMKMFPTFELFSIPITVNGEEIRRKVHGINRHSFSSGDFDSTFEVFQFRVHEFFKIYQTHEIMDKLKTEII